MGKRSSFKRRKQDFYETFDPRAVRPLLPHLSVGIRYGEVCVGDMALVLNLATLRPDVRCTFMSDIQPRMQGIVCRDACNGFLEGDLDEVDIIITNPPWTRQILHAMIMNLIRTGKQVWLLFDSDWAFTGQAEPYIKYCDRIIAVGRAKWIRGSKHDAMDSVAWYRFSLTPETPHPQFFGRIK